MPAFDHKPNLAAEQENEQTIARRSRIGLVLFFIYLALYAGFMYLSAFEPERMETTPWAGVNLAVLYGFGLIVAALVLALVYAWLCRERKAA